MRPRAPRPARIAAALALAATAATAPAQSIATPPPFRYERPLVLHEPGPQRLALPVPLLVGSAPFLVRSELPAGAREPRRIARGGLRDLRFYDAHGREVPYLLVDPPADEPPWHAAAGLLPVPATKKESGFEADLGKALDVDRVRVVGLEPPFLKRIALDGSGDRQRWVRLVPQATLFDLPDSNLRQLELAFRPGVFRYLRVTWDDASSARMALPSELLARPARAGAPAEPALASGLAFERRPSEPGTSRFRVRLPAASLPIVALRLGVGGGNLSRRASVSESRLTGAGAEPVRLGEAALRRAVRDAVAAEELRIPIEPPNTAQLELEIDDGDNPPLGLVTVDAELAELPFLYLEPEQAGTLVARWGSASLEAPRYDLESARERAARAASSSASWGETRPGTPESEALAAPALVPAAGASLDASGFRYTRVLSDAPAGLVAVPLDAAVLAHSEGRPSGSFGDLRVVDGSGRQLPYLLDRRPEPLVIALEAEPLGEAPEPRRFPPGTSFYRIRLPHAGLPPARLVLRTRARVFEREVQALSPPAPGERRKRGELRLLAASIWRAASPDDDAPALTLALPTLAADELRLAVHDGDNSPLPLEAPELLLPSWHVRFFRPGPGELRVVYGRRMISAPRYDLSLLAATVLASPAREAALSPEQERPPAAPVVLRPGAFWALMVAAVAVLLVLIARLVRGAAPSGTG